MITEPVTRASLLAEAGTYVHTDRNSNYGDPEDNFGVIAEIMAAYLSRRFGVRIPIAPYDVANLMFAVKLGRLAHNPLHHDSYVDMAGYAAAGAEVASLYQPSQVTQLSLSDVIKLVSFSAPSIADLEEFFTDVEDGPDVPN
jgi:hypothetical protein